MKSLFVIWFAFALAISAKAQGTLIIQKDSVRLTTEIISIRDNLLVVRDGALSLPLIYKVMFTDSTEVETKRSLINSLIKRGVLVYLNGRRLALDKNSTGPEPTVADSIASSPTGTNKKYQDNPSESPSATYLLGVGVGINYGQFGTRTTVLPFSEEKLQPGVFVSLGYALSGVAINGGIVLRVSPNERIVPTLSAFYGYNAAIKIIGAPQYDKVYSGPSVAFGIEVKSRKENNSFIHMELVLPFRSQLFYDDLKALQNNPTITGLNDPAVAAFSIGYHIKL